MAPICRIAISSRVAVIPRSISSRRAPGLAALAFLALAALAPGAQAFSQITREDGAVLGRGDIITAPLPPLDPARRGPSPDAPAPVPGAPVANDAPLPDAEDAAVLPVRYGADDLPPVVRDLRARLVEIAEAGEIEALRPYLETGADATALSVVPIEGDPIEFLKSASGDGEGVEILAILLDVLGSGYVRLDEGEDSEIFVWPYFAQTSIEDLTRPQLVELFQIVTAGDYEQMRELGAYYFYRVGISPDGRLQFFLAGD